MTKIKDIYDFVDSIAPYNTQLGFDNSGLNVGSMFTTVNKIGVCLDITSSAIDFAVQNGIDLIISHHPVIFHGLKNIDNSDVTYKLIENNIAAISAHTNLDAAHGGVCEIICAALGVKQLENAYLDEFPNMPIARIGTLEKPQSSDDFAKFVKSQLNAPDVRYASFGEVNKVGVFNGAGSDLLQFALMHGADSVVTSEVKHHEWIYANEHHINLYDVGHFSTENLICGRLTSQLNNKFGDIAVIIPQTAPYNAI